MAKRGFKTTSDYSSPPTVIGSIVLQEMRKRGWSQNELAHKAGLSQPSVRDILLGVTKNPRIDVVTGLARAFGVTPLHLLGMEPMSTAGDGKGALTVALTAQASLHLADSVETMRSQIADLDKRLSGIENIFRLLYPNMPLREAVQRVQPRLIPKSKRRKSKKSGRP